MSVETIDAVTVNQNTSEYTELMLRSLFKRHTDLRGVSITVLDNNSDDNTSPLKAYLKSKGIPFVKTQWTPRTAGNNHGENLRDFTLSHPDADYLLFLDPDIVFLEDETITTMMSELKKEKDAWAIQARISYDGKNEQGSGSRDMGGQKKFQNIAFEDTYEEVQKGAPLRYSPLPAVMGGRIRPFCCLIKNTKAFQLTASEIGFSCAHFEESGCGKVYDTMGAATQVMRTHGLDFVLSSKMILHFGSVTYGNTPAFKVERRQRLLAELRLEG
jgi:hypothetical protein